MNIIATMDKNRGLSWKRKPLVSIPADYRFLNEETKGKAVVMTEDMLMSLPGGKPVGGRKNFILTNSKTFMEPGAEAAMDIDSLRERLKEYKSDDIYILGGQPLFDEFLEDCTQIHVTWIDYSYKADSFFPEICKKREWKLKEKTEEQTYYDLEYYFLRFEKE